MIAKKEFLKRGAEARIGHATTIAEVIHDKVIPWIDSLVVVPDDSPLLPENQLPEEDDHGYI